MTTPYFSIPARKHTDPPAGRPARRVERRAEAAFLARHSGGVARTFHRIVRALDAGTGR